MSKLIKYVDLWEEDAKFDMYEVSRESARTPLLHSKYMGFLSKERLVWKIIQEEKKVLESKLMEYYTGKLDGKEIGRPAYQFTETKGSAEKKIEVDPDIIKLNKKIIESDEVVHFLKEVIVAINQRNYQLRAVVDWEKFKSGR